MPATFFVIGAQAADRPDLLRRMYAEGHEVGVHTFTHANLANVSALRQRIELDQTQLAIAAATGRTTGLLRPPYSSEVSALLPSDWRALSRAEGYWVVFTDLDTRDWERRGAERDRPGRRCPAAIDGAIVTMHDGGGDRAQTVAALRVMIGELRARGYTFDTVSSAVGLSSPWHAASPAQRLQGQLISGVVRLSTLCVVLLKIAFLLLAALAVARTVLLVLVARRHERERGPGPSGLRRTMAGGVGRRSRLQRGGRHRRDRAVPGRLRLPRAGDHRRRRRLDGCDGCGRRRPGHFPASGCSGRPTPGSPPPSTPGSARPGTTYWSWSTATPSSSRTR